MASQPFQVQRVDHIELFVPDQYAAAHWYAQLFGLQIVPEFEEWAADGPLMITSSDSSAMLALFEGESPGFRTSGEYPRGFRRVAFRVDAEGFFQFLEQVREHGVYSHQGQPVHQVEVVDHEKSYSVYFCDPYGNRYEVTTYAYAQVAARLADKAAA